MESAGSPIVYKGKPATQIIAKDITERKEFEEALRNSEQTYRMMFESNPNPMWIYETDSLRFLSVNAAAISRYGYSREEFLAMTLKEIRPKNSEVLIDDVAKMAEGRHDSGVWNHRKKDGTVIDVEIISHNLKIDGKYARVVLAHDITERKRAEDELKRARIELELRVKERTAELAATIDALQSEISERRRTAAERNKLVAAVEATAEAIVVTDSRGMIQYVNPAFEQSQGTPREEAIGTISIYLTAANTTKSFFCRCGKLSASEGVWKGRLINKKKDGTIYYEDCTYSPVRDPSGDIVNYVSIKHDVTEKLTGSRPSPKRWTR